MYNGIGLETARGSGTNGYVQRNMAFIRQHKDRIDYKSEEELRKLDLELNRGPSREILDHERKRKVELKCMEMQELMEEQGYSEEEISRKVSVYRQMLMENLQNTATTTSSSSAAVEKDEAGRPIAKETHQIAAASEARNEQLRAAFGLSEFYKDGTSLDPQRKAKEQAAQALAAAQKKYALVNDESSSSSSSSSPSPSPEHKKKHKEKDKSDKPDASSSHKAHKNRSKQRTDENPAEKKKKSSASLHKQKDKEHREMESLSPSSETTQTKQVTKRRSRSVTPALHSKRTRREKARDDTTGVQPAARQQEDSSELKGRHERPRSSSPDNDRQTQRRHRRGETTLKQSHENRHRRTQHHAETETPGETTQKQSHENRRSKRHSGSESPPRKQRKSSTSHNADGIGHHDKTSSTQYIRPHKRQHTRHELDTVD